MTTTQTVTPRVDVTLDGAPGPVKPTAGAVSLAALRVPYAAATIVLPLTADTLLDALDPRDDHRVIINAGNAGHWEITASPGYGHGAYGHGAYGNE